MCENDFRVGWRYHAHNIILTVLVYKRANQRGVEEKKARRQTTLRGTVSKNEPSDEREADTGSVHLATAGKKKEFFFHTDSVTLKKKKPPAASVRPNL